MKKKTGRKLLGFALVLSMVVGLLSGMSTKAYAEGETDYDSATVIAQAGESSQTFHLADCKAYHGDWDEDLACVVTKGAVTIEPVGDIIVTDSPGWDINDLDHIKITVSGGDVIRKVVFTTQGRADSWKQDGTGVAFTRVGSYNDTISRVNLPSAEFWPTNNMIVTDVTVYYGDPMPYPSVTITKGNNMTKAGNSGDEIQTNVSDSITPVIYIADDGYYFPTNYSVAAVNGISVKRDSDTQITVSGTPTDDAKITLTAPTPVPASVTKAPEAQTLTYTGSKQALVTAGEAKGGEMQYALGTANGPAGSYATTVPTATDAGTYYVWYKTAGDASHSDSEPACVEVTIQRAAWQDVAAVLSANLTLGGELGLNFHLNVPDDVADGVKVVMEGPEGVVESALAGLSKDEGGRYVASYPVAAIWTDRDVTLKLVDGDVNKLALHNSKGEQLEGDAMTYSVYRYCQDALSEGSTLGEEWQAKVRATYTYCAYAVRWKYGKALPEGVNALPYVTADSPQIEVHRAVAYGTAPAGVVVTGVSLMLESDTSLRLYFTCDGDVPTVTVDGKEVSPEPTGKGSKYYVQVGPIGVKYLGETHTVSFDGGVYEVELDALSYVYGALWDEGTEQPLADVSKALWAYSVAFDGGTEPNDGGHAPIEM